MRVDSGATGTHGAEVEWVSASWGCEVCLFLVTLSDLADTMPLPSNVLSTLHHTFHPSHLRKIIAAIAALPRQLCPSL